MEILGSFDRLSFKLSFDGEKKEIICTGMVGCYRLRGNSSNVDPLVDYGSLYHSNTLHGKLAAGRRFSVREQVPLRNAYTQDHPASSPDTSKNMVHGNSFLFAVDSIAAVPTPRHQ